MENNKKREMFSTGLAVFFATLGSAVGLGNIWKFPYLTGTSGGGAFVLIYVICVFLVGIPIMLGEFYIGRKSRKNGVGAFDVLKAHPFWKAIGYLGLLSVGLIVCFYSGVAGWVYSYIFKSITGMFVPVGSMGMEGATDFTGQVFANTIGGGLAPIFWQFVVLAVVSGILIGGVKNGIERATKTMMPVLFVLIIICCIRAITLPGAMAGLDFLFRVDIGKITPDVFLTALGLAFFKLSLGLACMLTYASYFTEDNNMLGTSVKVAFSDTAVSILAGIAIFPVVFTFGLEPNSGPGLLFQTIPLVFSQLPLGNVLLAAFFLLTGMAATMAMISMVEVGVAILHEEFKLSRTKAVLITTITVFAVGALTVHPSSPLGGVKVPTIIFGDNSFFDLFDNLSSKLFMPVGGILIALFAGHACTKASFVDELTNRGTVNVKTIGFFVFALRYVAPVIISVVFLNGIGAIEWIRGLF